MSVEATAEPRSGAKLTRGELFAGRYAIEDPLGRGGMGAVYRARDVFLDETIALKVLDVGVAPTPTAVLRFREEVRLARRVTHPKVARVFDIGEHEGVLFLTMELIEGSTLRDLLKAEPRLDRARAAGIAQAIVEGLSAVHAAGIIHRDLKPENILIDRSGRVALSDFGIARNLTGDLDITSGVLGTPNYMAPEQASARNVDARADIYALGLVLFELFTGVRPLGATEGFPGELARAGMTPAFVALVLRCIELDPAARPRSVDEIRRLLHEASPDVFVEYAGGDARSSQASPAPPSLSSAFSLPGTLTGERALAILPLRFFGPPDQAYLGDVLTEELVDALSRTRGLRVLGTGATAKYRSTRDPQEIGRELSVLAVVDGTAQLAASRIRIAVRLVDAERGVQLWSDHYEGDLSNLFELQTSIARRIAEHLRVELTTLAHSGGAPAEAIELYLTARSRLRSGTYTGAAEAAGLFARSIALAPRFSPALAGHALACMRSWFLGVQSSNAPDWEAVSRMSVERAVERASDLAEAHYAAGMFATQYGDFASAVRSLARALVIAPTYAEAHEYLGMLEFEAGRGEAGAKRMRLAVELNPSLIAGFVYIARHHELAGDHATADALLEEVARQRGDDFFTIVFARIRYAAWRRDHGAIIRWLTAYQNVTNPARHYMQTYAETIVGARTGEEAEQIFGKLVSEVQNPRMIALTAQLRIEAHAGAGRPDVAMMHLFRVATSVLVDIDWLNRCPLLVEVRAMPRFDEVLSRVRARADALWTL